MIRKSVRRRLKSLGSLRSQVRRHRKRLARRLAAHGPSSSAPPHGAAQRRRQLDRGLPPSPAAAAPESPERVFHSLDAELAELQDDLRTVEDSYASARDRVDDLRRERHRALSALRRRQHRAKQVLRELAGRHDAGAAATPGSAAALAREVLRTVAFLHRFESPGPQPIAGDAFDAGALAAVLDGGLDRLLAVSEQLLQALKTATAARRRADDVSAEIDRALPGITRELQGICRRVVERALAGRRLRG